MNEVLKELLESSGLLTEDTVKQITEAFDTQLAEAIEEAKKDATIAVTAEIAEQYVQERNQLIEATDARIDAAVAAVTESLQDQINEFRDLEVEYTQRLVEEKQRLAVKMQDEVDNLVEAIDAFLELRLEAEVEELREGIEKAQRNQFADQMFEAFAERFRNEFAPSEGSAEAVLAQTQEELRDVLESLVETSERVAQLERESKMKDLLSVLHGDSKEIMESLLSNVATEKLDEAFDSFSSRVIATSSAKPSAPATKPLKEGVELTGDDKNAIEQKLNEGKYTPVQNSQTREISRLKELAGI